MKLTLAERLAYGLTKVGWTEVQNPRSHYREFARPGTDRRMFVGKAGALRIGRCASQSSSAQYTSLYKELLALSQDQVAADKPQPVLASYLTE